MGGQDVDEDEQKRVWKLHFARQITVAEQTIIITFRSTHLTANEQRGIENLMDGKFDEQVLQKLFTRLSNSFPTYAPDKCVMDYLNQHSSSLHWDKKLDFLACADSSRDSNNGNIQSVRLSQLLNAWLQGT